ncbi:MAG: glutamate-5-semialdehyde dehydrogenase [Rikenellaceae bacterium]
MDLKPVFEGALESSRTLSVLEQEQIDAILQKVADAAVAATQRILEANALDLAKMERSNPLYDRLLLTAERIEGIANDMRSVSMLRSPVGEEISSATRPNGMEIRKVRVPFGVIGVIYEARPNVSFDVFALCFKTANACILKGGSDAHNSNSVIVEIIREVLRENGIDERVVTLLPADREATAQLLNAEGYVDLLIPRGSSALINYVRHNASIPVIETGAGICHTYVNECVDVTRARDIITNAKTRRVSVCNALDCVVIDSSRVRDLPEICCNLASKNVTIYADPDSYSALIESYPADLLQHATEESFGTEFMDYKMAIKCVAGIDEAIAHISRYSSRHSESIVTEDLSAAQKFMKMVDAACVYHNVSTAFTDGAQFGFGAEIGISTQKLHARGPMALPELTTYKYIITGSGQIRD